MGTDQLNPVSMVVIAVFIIMAVVAIGAIVVAIVHMVGAMVPQSARESLQETVDDWRRSVRSFWRRLRRADDDNADDDGDDSDLNEQAMQLLAMMPMLAVLTDEAGHVTRANPKAYQLGIVNGDDEIADADVAQAIAQVVESGGSVTVHVVTQTPKHSPLRVQPVLQDGRVADTPLRVQPVFQNGPGDGHVGNHPLSERGSLDTTGVDLKSPQSHIDSHTHSHTDNSIDKRTDKHTDIHTEVADGEAIESEVSRRNWLTITVGALSDDLVACLIRDDSEQHRFARIQHDFATHVAARLLEPMRNLERLGDDLSQEDADVDQIMAGAGKVHEYASTTAHILADLLLLIRAQSPVDQAHGDTVDMADAVRAAVAQHEAISRNAGVPVRVRLDDGLVVRGDSEQLQAAIARLVANAIIYSPTGAIVDVIGDTVTQQAEHGLTQRMVRIRVIDRGVGIDSADIEDIFKRFRRGHNQPQWPGRDDIEHGGAAQGVGLGLAIVKHVALAHEGTAVAWSRKGAGSTFTFTLPCLDQMR